MGIYWKNIDPEMQILGPTQQFIFNQNLNQFQFDNTFVPTSLVPSQNLFELRNSGLSGFRFRHETAFGDTHGTLKIQSFLNGQTTGTDLMTFNEDGTITIDAGLVFDDLNFTKLGIGINPSTDGRIEFANTSLDTKIRFFTNNTPGNTFDQSGFGYLTGGGTIYHCPIGKSHLFFTGANGNNPVEINDLGMRVSGTGISSTDFRKVIFWEIANNPHQTNAIGVQLDGLPSNYTLFRQQVASINNSFTWNYGTSDTTSNELMRLHPTNGLIVKNQIVPTEGNPTHTYFKIENLSGGGHRFVHSITAGGIPTGVGSLTLQVMDGSQSTIDILNFGFSTLSFPGFGGDTYAIFGGFNANAANATLGVNEGKWNVSNEASCFRVVSLTNSAKIEIQNTSISGRLYELRSNSDGSFGIFDRTSNALRLGIDSSGNITGNFPSSSLFSTPQSLPYPVLTFNWSYDSVTNPSPYEFVNNFTDSQISKNFKYRIATTDMGAREWNHDYTLIGNSDLNGIYNLNYKVLSSTYTPLSIQIYPFASSQNLMSIGVPIDMGGFEIKNALNPTTAQSLATKNYVDTSSLTLTGSVTGSGNVNGLLATSFSNNQTVIGGDTQTFTFDPSFASAYFNMFNSNVSATTQWQVGNSNQYLAGGYAASGGYAFLRTNNANSLQFLINGTTRATLTAANFTAPTIVARRPSALMTMQGNVVGTTVTTGGLFYKVAGTTSISNANEVTMSANNRLQYALNLSSMAYVSVFFTASHNGAGRDEIEFALYKNGTQISNSIISGQDSNNKPTSYALGTLVSVSTTTDYVELWCSHPANGKIITVKNMIFIFSTT